MNKKTIKIISLCGILSFGLYATSLGAAGQSTVKLVHIDRLDQSLAHGTYTVENARGFNNAPAYPNQDSPSIYCMLGRAVVLMCDGHGTAGDVVADKVTSLLPLEVLKAKDAATGFKNGCAKLQQMFAKADYAQQSGSTCVGAQISGNKLTIANVGDSRLIVIRPNNAGTSGSVVFSTIDHKPTNKNEYARIKAAKGAIIAGYVAGNNGNGLAVTRSLGDAEMTTAGVIAEPELFEFTLQSGDIIFLATDGYWDVFSNSETVSKAIKQLGLTHAQFGSKHLQAAGATFNSPQEVINAVWNKLYCTSFARWSAECARVQGSRDDITVTVIRYSESQG